MARPPIAPIEELEGFMGILEHARLELLEAIVARDKYSEADLEKLALHGGAIQSVKDAIAFSKAT
jgi:hypothetical protein